jgi:hypothetical protein
MEQNGKNTIPYPENKRYAELLDSDERKMLARKTGYTLQSLNNVLNGTRPMKTRVKRAIVEIIQERREAEAALEQALAENSNS